MSDEEKRQSEDQVDEAAEDTFPASDPPATSTPKPPDPTEKN